MNSFNTAMLHVTRTAGVDPQAAASYPDGLGLAFAALLARVLTSLARVLGHAGRRTA